MRNNQESGPTTSRQLLMKGCRNISDRLIGRVGGLPMVLMDLLMERVDKQLAEVPTR